MAQLVRELIISAYYLSGIVARIEETVSGDQINDGLRLLNALISFKTANSRLIPYYTQSTINLVVGQEMYFFENLIDVEALTFNLSNVRYSLIPQSRKKYFGSPRVNNIQALPGYYRVEKVLGGANIFIYFLPNQTYQLNLMGKYALTEVTLDQDLDLILDKYYVEYLRYALAQYLCPEYQIEFAPQALQMLQMYEANLPTVTPPDVSVQKTSYFGDRYGPSYPLINLGQGWVPL